jgi:ABC-type branched-subunit amino acid transport system ATPase component
MNSLFVSRVQAHRVALYPRPRDILPHEGDEHLLLELACKSAGMAVAAEQFEATEGVQTSIIKDIERVSRILTDRGEMAIWLVEQHGDFAVKLADDYLVMARGEFLAYVHGESIHADGVIHLVAL